MALAVLTALSANAAPARATDDVLLPGEVSSSNMDLLSHKPKDDGLLGFNTDIAFQGDYAFAGNDGGFTVWDISDPADPEQALEVVCPGEQNDISVYENLLVLSTDVPQRDDSCDSEYPGDDAEEYWEGLKIWDISDPLEPRYVQSVETNCGSHTNSLAPSKNGKSVYVYVSSFGPISSLPSCQPPHDSISIVKVPLKDLTKAKVVNEPVLFPDGGLVGDPDLGTMDTSGCHDITTYAELDLAAGACMGDGILMDISDRENPEVISDVRDTENFAFWHSATFNNDGTKVVFTDELGGGFAPTCTAGFRPEQGADGIYDIIRTRDGVELELRSYFKIPRNNAESENCVAHNGSLIPVEGRDLMVQSWYQGGTSVFDFTDSAHPVEVAHFDRGMQEQGFGGTWSSYYYNGYVYSNDMTRGWDVFDVDDSIDGDAVTGFESLNPQTQESFTR